MRLQALGTPSFFGGLVVGLAAGAVTVVIAEALRRRRSDAAAELEELERPVVIDGVRVETATVLEAMPPPERPPEPLESEAPDVPPDTQRW